MLLALSLLVFLPLRSAGLASDGARYLELIEAGALTNPHFLYLPLVALVRSPFALEAHDAATLASALAAALGVALLATAIWRRAGLASTAFATALLLFCPALRVQAGAVEVHAAAFFAASIAWTCVAPLAPRRAHPWRSACAGGVLVLGHLSACLWLPALACAAASSRGACPDASSHDACPAASSRRKNLAHRARATHALACLAGGAAGLAAIFVAGWWAAPLTGETLSPLRTYWHHWTSGVAMPERGALLDLWTVEFAAPLGLLLTMAFAGAGILLWRRERASIGLALALLPGPCLALVIGAQENGAYVLPALPPLAICAARAARALSRAPRFAVLLVLVACSAEHFARATWAMAGPLPRGSLVAEDAGLTPSLASTWAHVPLLPTPFWIALSFAAAGGAALALRRRSMRSRRGLGLAFLAVVVMGQIGLARAVDTRTPSRDQRELFALGRAFRAATPYDPELLVSIEATGNARAILRRALGREARFLPSLADGSPDAARAARDALRSQLAASGRRASFPPDLFSSLVARSDAEAIDWVRAQEEAGLLLRLPARDELRSLGFTPRWDPQVLAYAARAEREIENGARLLTCVPDPALRGALAAQLDRPFRDLSSEPLPPIDAQERWILCDRGLVLWLDLAPAVPTGEATTRALRERVASGALGRWKDTGSAAERAEAFWVAARSGR